MRYGMEGVGCAKGTVATSRAQAPAAEDRRPHTGIYLLVTSGLEEADAKRRMKSMAVWISFQLQGEKMLSVRGSHSCCGHGLRKHCPAPALGC